MQIYISFAKRSTAIRKKTHFFILHLPPEAHPPQAPLSHPPGHGHRLLNKNSPDSIPLYRQATATLSAKRRQPTGNPSPSLLQASSTLPTSLQQTIAKPPPLFQQASEKPSPSLRQIDAKLRTKNLPFCQFHPSLKSRKKAIFTPFLIRYNSRPSSYQILPNFLSKSNPILR